MAGSLSDDSPRIAALSGGGYLVSWEGVASDGQSNDIYVQRFDADGRPAQNAVFAAMRLKSSL